MKKICFSLMIGAAMLFASCKDDPKSNPPAAAGAISGLETNTCPVRTVVLSVEAVANATSYQWYKNGAEITGATASTYEATATAAYTVAGVNNDGAGAQSPAKNVTIVQCNVPDAAGTIQGASLNECGETSVRLAIAEITGATSYQWYKDGATITGATDTVYTATQSGSYTVEGVNINGAGAKSPVKVVGISDCVTINGADVNACGATSVALSITIPNATSYQWYKNATVITGATSSSYAATASGTYSVEGFDASNKNCGQGRGKVVNIYTACRTDIVGSYTLTAIAFRVDASKQAMFDSDTLINGVTYTATVTISVDPTNENGVLILGSIPPVSQQLPEDAPGTFTATFNRANNSLSIAFPQNVGLFPQGWEAVSYPAYFEGGTFKYYDTALTKTGILTYNATTKTYIMDIGYNTWSVDRSMFVPTGSVKPGTFRLTKIN